MRVYTVEAQKRTVAAQRYIGSHWRYRLHASLSRSVFLNKRLPAYHYAVYAVSLFCADR